MEIRDAAVVLDVLHLLHLAVCRALVLVCFGRDQFGYIFRGIGRFPGFALDNGVVSFGARLVFDNRDLLCVDAFVRASRYLYLRLVRPDERVVVPWALCRSCTHAANVDFARIGIQSRGHRRDVFQVI